MTMQKKKKKRSVQPRCNCEYYLPIFTQIFTFATAILKSDPTTQCRGYLSKSITSPGLSTS